MSIPIEGLLHKTWSSAAHHYGMPYIWTVSVNVAVFVVLYKYRPLWMIAHTILAGAIVFMTLLFAIPILRANGIPNADKYNYQRHYIIGVVILVLVCLQTLLGILSSVMKMMKSSPTIGIFASNTIHKYFGYVLLFLGKFQMYYILDNNGNHPDKFWGLFASDVIFFLLFVAQKIYFPTFAEEIMPLFTGNMKTISSVQELKKDPNEPVGVFANYVFDLKNLQMFHPAGYRIIEGVKYRDFDRYLYGMYRSERENSVPVHVHSYKALTLVGDPIAKLNIPQIYKGLENEFCDVKVRKVTTVSETGQIYQVQLESAGMEPFEYLGYQDLHQLGRFFSLTLNKKVTRLYTSVGFLDAGNLDLMEKSVF